MFPFETLSEMTKRFMPFRTFIFVALYGLAFFSTQRLEAKVWTFNSKIRASTDPFGSLPIGTDTIIIRDTFEINVNYEPILYGLPYDHILRVEAGGVLYWSSNVFLKLGSNARILLYNGGHIYPGSSNDIGCNAAKTIYFDIYKLASCSGTNALHAFSDVNTAGCFDGTGICCDATITALDNSGNANDFTLCQPGDSVELSVTGSGSINYTFTWTPLIGPSIGPYKVAQAATTTYSVSIVSIFDPFGSAPPYLLTCGNSLTVKTNSHINLTTATTPVPCASSAVGVVNLSVSGGTAPYKFLWSNGKTTEDINNLIAGTYTVTVTDAKGCTNVKSATVITFDNTPPALTCPSSASGIALPNQCTTSIPNIDAIFSDNCPAAQLTYNITGATIADGVGQLSNVMPFRTGLNNIEYKVSDGSNTVSCSFSVTVQDNQYPTATNPPIMTGVQCLGELPAPDPSVVTDEADNCGAPTVTFLSQSIIGGLSCPGNPLIVSRKYRVIDASGNGITVTQHIHVADSTPPMFIQVPANTTVTCQSIPPVGIASASDNCNDNVVPTYIGETRTNGACPDTYTLTRTWKAQDNCGNSTIASQTIQVQDVTSPVFSFVPANVTVNCQSIPAVGTANASDNCDAAVSISYVGETRTDGACQNAYTLRRIWKAEDNCGNTSTSEQTITVQDVTSPAFTSVPTNITVTCTTIPVVGTAVASDNCDPTVAITYLGETRTNGACQDAYTLRRTWRAEDNCGNSTSAAQIITVQDITSPTFTAIPANITVSCESIPALGNPVATDNCAATVSITYNGETRTNGACPYTYSLKRQWTAADNCGNTTTAIQVIAVQDITKPVFTFVPANTTVSCDALPSVGAPVASDNCDPSVGITYNGEVRQDGACLNSYQLRRRWTAADQCGNTTTVEQVITVQDITKPNFTQVPANITVSCDAIPTVGTSTATDNCDAVVDISFNGEERLNGSCENSYSLRREWIASDNCGNTALATQVITVRDLTPPVFTSVPAPLTVSCEAIPTPGIPTASDNCASSVTISYLGESVPGAGGACPGNYALVRTWAAQDDCGNSATATQTITVQDIAAPVVLTVPANVTVSCAAIPAVGTPTATDNCDANLGITYNGATRTNGSCPNSYTLQRKWTIADDCGNTATAIQTVTVEDITPPVFTSVPSAITVSCDDIPTVGAPVAADDCATSVSIVYNGAVRTDGVCPDSYLLNRSWTAMDSCGNTTSALQVITVRDITPPVYTSVPAPVTVSCDAIPAVGTPVAIDNCDAAVNISYNGEARLDGDCPFRYTLRREWLATDNCGNTAVTSQLITVQDITAPVFTAVPAAVTAGCDAIPAVGTPAATDNCSAAVTITYIGETRADGVCPGYYTLRRTWAAQDECGNSVTASQIISVQDIVAPVVLSVPANVTVSCAAIPAVGTPTASDNCDANPTITYNGATRTNGNCPNSYTLQRQWIIKDHCGNTTMTAQTLTVEDITAPVFTATPAAATVSCESIPAVETPTAVDDCASGVSITYNGVVRIDGACPDSYQLQRTWTARDSCGNTATTVQIITVQDITPPNFTLIPSDVTVSCDGIPPVSAPTATDNCDVFVNINFAGQVRVDGSCTHGYLLRREWVAADNCGNTSKATQVITVQDVTAPVFTSVPSPMTVSCEAIPNVETPTVTDNCDASVTLTYTGETRTNGNCPSSYILKRSWAAQDDCGNISTASQVITVQDITRPTFAFVPKDTMVNCNAIPQPGMPIAIDNCTMIPTITFEGETVMNSTSQDSYSLQRMWTAADDCGNATTAIQMLMVQDTVAPNIQCPSNILLEADGTTCSAIANFNAPVTSDNCSTALTVAASANSGQAFPVGVTPVVMTVNDPSGNATTCSFSVTVRDTTAPVLANCPPDLTVTTDVNSCEAMVSWIAPTVSDPCDLYPIVPSVSTPSGTVFPTGVRTITYAAVDTSGNSTACSFTLTVREDVAPVLSNCPSDMVLYTNTCTSIANWAPPLASDNCALGTVIVSIPSGSTFPETSTVVQYTATDLWANTTTCTFTVTVIDIVAPQFSGCPDNMTVNALGSCEAAVSWVQPIATDNCSAAPAVFSVPTPGTVLPVGFTTVHVFVEDLSSNQDTCTFVVEVIGPDISLANLPVNQSFIGCNGIANWEPPVPVGICGPYTLVHNYEPGDTFDIGVTEVTYTLSDTLGHVFNTSFLVTVTESIPPQFQCPISPINVNIGATVLFDPSGFISSTDTIHTCNGVELAFSSPVATDNCSIPLVTQVSGLPTTAQFDLGTHTVLFQAKDDAGNTALCSVQIQVVPFPQLNPVVSDAIACSGDDITLSATVIPGATYFWTGPETSYPDNNNLLITAINNTHTGIYTIAATVNGCTTALDSALVRIGQMPDATDDLQYQVATNEVLVDFNVLLNDLYTPDDYTIQLSSDLPGLIDHGNGVFSFEAGNRNAIHSFFYTLCSRACPDLCDMGTVSIMVRERVCSYIPNIITPNGDGINDFLVIPCLDIEPYGENHLMVFNQWGQKVFDASPYSNDPDKAWRGTYNGTSGEDLPDATYYYLFKAKPDDVGLKGFVEIFR